jgi:MOSC domain-containing protein YiiM
LAPRWAWLVEGLDPALTMTRPGDGSPSLWDHAAGTVAALVPPTADAAYGVPADEPIEQVLGRLDRDAARADRLARAEPAWALECAHDGSHHLTAAGRVMAALGAGPAPGAAGIVAGLFASRGGVPKKAVDDATIGYRGLEGDRQGDRHHHGRVWQALCLWSADVVERLHADGHPIEPGAAGENISVTGLDWATLRPGVRLGIGADVVVELTAYSTPCSKNAKWFADRDFNRINHDRRRGSSRIYASVLRDGAVHPGDAVVVEP